MCWQTSMRSDGPNWAPVYEELSLEKKTHHCYHVVQVTWTCVVNCHLGSECQRLSSSYACNSCEGRRALCELLCWLHVCLFRDFAIFWTWGRWGRAGLSARAVTLTGSFKDLKRKCHGYGSEHHHGTEIYLFRLFEICFSFCGILFGAAEIRFILWQESYWIPCLLPLELRFQTSQNKCPH